MLFAPGTNDKPEDKAQSLSEPFNLDKTLGQLTDIQGIITSNTTKILSTFTESFNNMETAAIEMSTKFGGGRDMAISIKQSLDEAYISSAELGAQWDDIRNIQKGVVDGLQTQTVLQAESFKDLYAIGGLISDGTKTSEASTAKLVKSFTDAGYGLYNISGEMTKVLNTAREIGVTAKAVYAQLDANMGKLALYNFENGVQGMAKMAAQAAGLRIDMKTTLGLADSLFEPEKAMEMAASMQRLGVQVTSLLDPYKLMDMARNDPAKLQDEILKATKALTYFDEKNQKMSILPGAQGQLRELATAMNIPKEELAKMALNAGDLDRKLSQIKFPSSFANEEDKKMVANMAQLSGGTYVVQYDDSKTGEKVTKQISEIKPEDIAEMNKPAKSAVDLQKEANGYLKTMANSLTARKGIVGRKIAASTPLENVQKTASSLYGAGIDALSTQVGINREKRPTGDKSGFVSTTEMDKSLQELMSNGSSGIKDLFDKLISGGIKAEDIPNMGKDLETKISEIFKDAPAKGNEIWEQLKKDFKENRANGGATGTPTTQTYTGLEDMMNKLTNPNSTTVVPNQTTSITTGGQTSTVPATAAGTTQGGGTITQDISGTININVNVTPGSMKQEVVNALQTAEFQKSITKIVTDHKEESKRLGSGK
jgi:Cu/Ag efflux protein CusF